MLKTYLCNTVIYNVQFCSLSTLTPPVNLAVPSHCVASDVALCGASSHAGHLRFVFIASEDHLPPQFYSVVITLCCFLSGRDFSWKCNTPPPAKPQMNSEHNLGIFFQLESCICGVSFGAEAGGADRDQILNVVTSRLRFVSFTFQNV